MARPPSGRAFVARISGLHPHGIINELFDRHGLWCKLGIAVAAGPGRDRPRPELRADIFGKKLVQILATTDPGGPHNSQEAPQCHPPQPPAGGEATGDIEWRAAASLEPDGIACERGSIIRSSPTRCVAQHRSAPARSTGRSGNLTTQGTLTSFPQVDGAAEALLRCDRRRRH